MDNNCALFWLLSQNPARSAQSGSIEPHPIFEAFVVIFEEVRS
jgi:hypothetical protein